MLSLVGAIENTVPISMFNRGLAGKIFSDVKHNGPKVVLRNNAAEAVIIPPDEYKQMMEDLNDYMLLSKAIERMSSYDAVSLVSAEEVDDHLGITKEEIEQVGEVEIE